jgi:hypothetical protein
VNCWNCDAISRREVVYFSRKIKIGINRIYSGSAKCGSLSGKLKVYQVWSPE